MELPAIEKISESQQEDPFQVLIATLLSARTQDATTLAASTRLFARARTPRTLAALPVKEIERLIYPVSFYRNKARHVKAACQRLLVGLRRPRARQPLEELVTLPGVGRKTATLVLILAFQSRRHICVDTHVHRISNRLGLGAARRRPRRPSRRSTPPPTRAGGRSSTSTWSPGVKIPAARCTLGVETVPSRPTVPASASPRVGHSRKGES